MPDEIGFRLNDERKERRRKMKVILESGETRDAQRRLETAFEMLFNDIPPVDDPDGPVEPRPGTQLPLF